MDSIWEKKGVWGGAREEGGEGKGRRRNGSGVAVAMVTMCVCVWEGGGNTKEGTEAQNIRRKWEREHFR